MGTTGRVHSRQLWFWQEAALVQELEQGEVEEEEDSNLAVEDLQDWELSNSYFFRGTSVWNSQDFKPAWILSNQLAYKWYGIEIGG